MKLRLKAHIRKANVTEFDNYEAWVAACQARYMRISPIEGSVVYAQRIQKTDEGYYINEDGSDATSSTDWGMFDHAFDKGVLCDSASEFSNWMHQGDEPSSAWDADKDAF